jgi:hypothetical protein
MVTFEFSMTAMHPAWQAADSGGMLACGRRSVSDLHPHVIR